MKIVLVGHKIEDGDWGEFEIILSFLKPVHRKGRISVEVLEIKCYCGDGDGDGIAFKNEHGYDDDGKNNDNGDNSA